MPFPIPNVSRLPVVGALPRFLHDPVATLERALAKGNINRLGLGLIDPVLVHHPEGADYILRGNRRNFPKEGPLWSVLAKLMGNGLGTSVGDFWLRQRRMMQPHFHRRKLSALYTTLLASVADSMQWDDITDDWAVIDVASRIPHLAMNAASGALLGLPTSQEEARRIAEDVDYVVAHVFLALMTSRLPSWVPRPGHKRFIETRDRLRGLVLDIIAERRRNPNDVDDLLGLLISATDEESGEQMTDEQLLDETISLFLAGYETTASGLQWVLAHLAAEPEHLGRLREEVDALDGDISGPDCLRRLPYARWILQESLRLHAPAWWLPRLTREDDELEGFAVPAGTLIAPVVYTIQRHPDHWPDPSHFDPERFEPSRAAGRHPLAWIAFGSGPRKCIGQELSLMESTIALALLVQRYDIESVGHVVRPQLQTVLRPANGVRVRIRRRRSARRARRAEATAEATADT